ncbi:hypothetical protein AGABI2DRAFT_143963 [Agaricus bisporus var. bisporus H97]|uniref:hypothetical protein n=1 Tax=Agaricus bisporus var. bisporus (strain H97 / ATCC MYA-4626 / FGSC 10389) TaxID=936046 RepID=UPI00029F60AF|nr:hypothetical protein AGABI2DRAFT_143963 [Agaricus bisporus var. bisporus H97]EKV45521.1 hypothetical protein AGABI2DRAFT_143963 [Agaricus bisporus var. bisporus H97]
MIGRPSPDILVNLSLNTLQEPLPELVDWGVFGGGAHKACAQTGIVHDSDSAIVAKPQTHVDMAREESDSLIVIRVVVQRKEIVTAVTFFVARLHETDSPVVNDVMRNVLTPPFMCRGLREFSGLVLIFRSSALKRCMNIARNTEFEKPVVLVAICERIESETHYLNREVWIHNMASDRKRPWDLMPWTRERKLPAVEAILDSEGNSCNNEEKLFKTLHNTYNAVDNREVDMSSMYKELEEFEEREWVKFSVQEFHDVLKNCAKNTAPGPDHVSWRLWKRFATDDTPIATFGLRCWYKPGTRAFKTNIKMLRLTHNQGARWITGAFRTSPMGAMSAVAGLMPLHLQLKKLFERSVIRINTLHPHHPVLSLLERQKAKGSTLHPNTLERKSKTIRKVIKSPLDLVIDNPSSEIFDALSVSSESKDRDEYHSNLNLAPVTELNALHLFTAGVKHKFDPSVPIPHRTHSHIALVTVFKGQAITSKTRAARRRVNNETIVGWSTFLALIKAHKKLQKGWPISKVVLYTTSQLIVKNLMSTNSKPLGSQLSIAVSLAFDAIATDFPEVDIEVQKTTRDAIHLWQTGFQQGVCTPSEPPPHMPSLDGIGTRFGLLVRSQGFNVPPPHMLSSESIGTRSGLGNSLSNSWYDITDKEGNEVLPSHLQGGPWFQTYQGVKAANNSPLFARLMRVMCNHAPIGEYRVRFFPNKPYKACQCNLRSPETRQHLLMVCPLFVRQINHYDLDGITTIRGLILFLQDNPQVFSFKPPELPRHADESWPAYRRELELAREEENKRRKKQRLPPLKGPIFLHESIEFLSTSSAGYRLVE